MPQVANPYFVLNRQDAAFDLLAEYGYPAGPKAPTYSRRWDADKLARFPECAVLLHSVPFDPATLANRKRPLPGLVVIAARQRDPLEPLGWRCEHFGVPDEFAADVTGMDVSHFRRVLAEAVAGSIADQNNFSLHFLREAACIDFGAASFMRGLYLPNLSEIEVINRAGFIPALTAN